MTTTSTTTVLEIIGSMPNGVLNYTKGNGCADPDGDFDSLSVELEEITELTVDSDLHAEVVEQLDRLDPDAESGSIGDYRVFDITQYPEFAGDNQFEQLVVVWP